MTKPKIRIKDIAEMAGVSKGTVDRVLHNRGEVSEESLRKVKKVLREMNYEPNVYASALASKRTYRFLCLLPQHAESDYWAQVEAGVVKQAAELRDLGVSLERIYFDQYDMYACQSLFESVAIRECDGVVLAPLFKEPSLMLARTLMARTIPVVFVDSHVADARILAYYGMDSACSGKLAATLLLAEHPDIKDVVMFHLARRGESEANQTRLRREGFMEYVREQRPRLTVHSLALSWNDREGNTLLLDRFFAEHPEVKAGLTFNSRAYMIAEYLNLRSKSDFRLLGYDLLEGNVGALKAGHVSYLIAQRPEQQGYHGLRALAQSLIFHQKPAELNLMPMDILTKENIDFYLNFPSI